MIITIDASLHCQSLALAYAHQLFNIEQQHLILIAITFTRALTWRAGTQHHSLCIIGSSGALGRRRSAHSALRAPN